MSINVELLDRGTYPTSTEVDITRPVGRQGHSGYFSKVQTALFVFGGRARGRGRIYLNDLWKFDLEKHEWECLETSGEYTPVPRHNHSCVMGPDGHSMYLFGGQTDKDEYLDDLFVLDTESLVWTGIIPQQNAGAPCPAARHAHTCVANSEYMILFGGRSGFKPPHFANDVWLFNFASKQWNQLNTSGKAPPGRSYASGCLLGDKFVIFGGYWWDGREHYLNDTFVLDLKTSKWEKLNPKGELPHERNRNSLTPIGPNQALMFGGNHFNPSTRKDVFHEDYWLLDISGGVASWQRLTSAQGCEKILSPRGQHLVVQSDGVSELICFGGECESRRFNDIFKITKI